MEDDEGSSFKALVVGTGFGCRIQVRSMQVLEAVRESARQGGELIEVR